MATTMALIIIELRRFCLRAPWAARL